MRKSILLLTIFCLTYINARAQDVILKRNGEELNCKIEIINNGDISYQTRSGNGQVNTKDIYMIKYEKRGVTFFNPDGSILSSTSTPAFRQAKKEIVIYLCSGAEIFCSEVNVTQDNVYYKAVNKKKPLTKSKDWFIQPKENVFLIKYADGIREIITSLESPAEDTEVSVPEPQVVIKHPFIPVNKDPKLPCPSELTLSSGQTMSVITYDLDREYIYYRQKEWQDGPIFRIKRNKLSKITLN